MTSQRGSHSRCSHEWSVVAFCWYQREEWEKLKATAVDKDTLDDSYDEWKTNATSAIKDLRNGRQLVQKVKINIDQLDTWCEENGLENNSAARSHFAGEKLQQRSTTLQA